MSVVIRRAWSDTVLRAAMVAALTLGVMVAACSGARAHPVRAPEASDMVVRSNVMRGDYVGSARCEPCHADVYRRFMASPMHRMTRAVEQAEIRAPFDHNVFRFGDSTLEVSTEGTQRIMTLIEGTEAPRRYRITRVIGGRYREDFAGVAMDTDTMEHASHTTATELVMPVSYVFSTQSWRYKGYSVMVRERPGMRAGPVWEQSCIFCHNTEPYLSTVYDDLYGAGARGYQGSFPNNLVPPRRAVRLTVTDPNGLADALRDEIARLDGHPLRDQSTDAHDLLDQAALATWRHFDATQLVEVGIGCESCHNGAREHADDPRVQTSLAPRSPWLRTRDAADHEPAGAEAINQVCLRCHTVLFSHYPYTWEGGRRSDAMPGGSHINSGEARDFQLGGCAAALSCTTCHDPHAEDSAERLAEIQSPAGNSVCLGCHQQYAGEAALRAHTHHAPGGEGAVCINCHMPRRNMGLAYNLSRYHRIASPTEPATVEHDRPLECALCHADRSVSSLVDTMEHWWPTHHYDRAALQHLYGPDMGVNVMAAALTRGLPHEQATALGVLGRDRVRADARLMVQQLGNPFPLVRYFALKALQDTFGIAPPLDMNLTGPELVEQGNRWLRGQEGQRPTSPR